MKLRVLVLAALLVAAVLAAGGAVTPAAAQASGNTDFVDVNASDLPGEGTSDDPYEVSNASELQAMNDSLDAHYELVADVDASGTADWNDGAGFRPIAPDVDKSTLVFDGTQFTGRFDGRNHTISGLTINRSSTDFVGLFGGTDGSTITNVGLVDVDVTGDSLVGSFVGDNGGTIDASYATGNVTGDSSVGGLVGDNNFGTINASYATGTITSDKFVGGLVGANGGAIEASYATGTVTGDDYVGGLVGQSAGDIEASYATGTVNGTSNVGGLVGDNTGTVTDAYWDTESTTQSNSEGGEGLDTSEMTGVYAAGNMTGLDFQSNWTVTTGYPEFSDDPAAPFATSIVDTNSPVTAGEILTVDVRVENVGSETAQGDLELLAPDGSAVDAQDVTLLGGDDTTQTFTWDTQSGDSGGAIEIASPGENPTQSVTVGQSGPNFQTTITDVNGTVSTGETVVVDYQVENVGTAAGEQTIDLHVDDTPADEATGVTLADGESTNRTFAYEPSAGDAPAIDLTVQSYDDLAQETVTVNRPPVPSDDGYTVTEGEALAVGESDGVLANDTDPDGDALTAAAADLPEHGTLALAANGSFEYTPDSDFLGTDSFTYEPSDGTTTADETGTVTITVEEPQSGDGPAGMFGSGTEADPYEIENWYHLDNVSENLGANYTLANDLNESTTGYDDVASPTANGGSGFAPIAPSAVERFSGTFDGQNHTIGGLTIRSSSGFNFGLFGTTSEIAVITDVDLRDANVTGNDVVGGLVGRHEGTVERSSVTGTVTANNVAGGLVGFNFGGTVERSNATADVTGNGNAVGGLVGSQRNGDVDESYANGAVTGDGNVGGLVGLNYAGTVERSNATAVVTGNETVGGLVGGNNDAVTGSHAAGTVSGYGNIGGLVGQNDGTIEESSASGGVDGSSSIGGLVGGNPGGTVSESFATGDVGSASATSVGGLVGLSNSGTVEDSYATGNVTGDTYVGGVVGDMRTDGANDSVITRTYAVGNVTAGPDAEVGGIVGSAFGSSPAVTSNITDSYWDNVSTGQTTADGTQAVWIPQNAIVEDNQGFNTSDGEGRAAELTGDDAAGNMPALDFESTWTTVSGEYPALAWQDAGTGDDDPEDDPGGDDPDPGPGDANDPPNAADDDYVVYENGTLSVTAGNGTLANDADPDGATDDLVASVASEPADGSLAFHANGSFTYAPDPGSVGTDSFTYEVSDGDGGADTATVTITVASDGSAPDVLIDGVDAPDRVAPGEEIEVTADVTNAGSGTGEASVAVAVDGQQRGTEQVTLDPDGTTTVTFSATAPETAGNYSWTVSLDGDARSGTIAVDSADGADGETDEGAGDGDETDGSEADDGSPGFGVLAAGLGLFGALAIGRRLGWRPANGHDSD